MPCGEFGMAWPNWQVGVLSSVLIKPGFFLRKRLILRQAGRHAASRLWIVQPVKEPVSVPTSQACASYCKLGKHMTI